MKTDALFKMSDELVAKFKGFIESNDLQSQLKSIKDAGTDNGTFKMVISTDDTDRHGEIVAQDGWQFENYLQNPVVLWGHESYSIPVGVTDKLYMEVTGSRKSLVAEGRFAGHEFAQVLRQMYDAGMLKASSVGFIPLEFNGNIITKAELLEWSFVSIPANPFALDAAKQAGLDISMLTAKGFLKDVMKTGDEIETPADDTIEDEPALDADGNPIVAITDEELEALEVDDAIIDDETETLSLVLSDGTTKKFKKSAKWISEKAGRVLSKANKEKIINAKLALEEVIAMSESADAEDGKAIDVPADEKAEDVQIAEDYLKLRRSVQGIFGDLQNVLTEAKQDAIKRGIKSR